MRLIVIQMARSLVHGLLRKKENSMLGKTDAVANVAVKDLDRARTFYKETLGLTPIDERDGELIVFKSGSSSLNVYRSQYAGTNKATAVTWTVDDVGDTVRKLKAKGIVFEHYDLPDTTLRGDIHVAGNLQVAWFKDPDGNILNVVNEASMS
jgi:catechol 2,3-dioxygenase-like lactoylglutathione lyase family enzyme